MRYFVEIAYQGTNYHGWQIQPNAITVQETINNALSTMLRTEIHVVGSGRTDTGVHCKQQYFHFDIDKELDPDQLCYKLNAFLPEDIATPRAYKVPDDAHTRFSAEKRTYQYFISTKKDPFNNLHAYKYTKPLDLKLLNKATSIIKEYNDFEAFCKLNSDANHYLCDIFEAKWEAQGDMLVLTICANRFLRGMIRIITGACLSLANGKISENELRDIIETKKLSNKIPLVPGHGLFLTKVEYPTSIIPQ